MSYTVKQLLSEVNFAAASKSFGKVKPASEILKKAEKAEKRYGNQKEDPKKDDKDELDEAYDSAKYEHLANVAKTADETANDFVGGHKLAAKAHVVAAKHCKDMKSVQYHLDQIAHHLSKADK